MARRGALTALQAVLAGISGGAGGYIQQQEMERRKKKDEEEKARQAAADAAGVRAEQRTIRSLGGTQVARAGEAVAGPMPSAIPLSGVGNAFAAAERAGGPATSRGALRQEVGGETFILPSLAEMEAQKTVKEEATRERKQNALLATLRNVPTGLITTAERPLIEQGILSGAIDEKDIVNLVTGRTETSRRQGAGAPNMANIRLAAVKNLTEELGRTPTQDEVSDYVGLVVPATGGAGAGISKMSQARTFIRQLKDQGVSRDEAEKQVRQRFPDEAEQILGRAPAAAAPLPTMNVRNEGFFGMPAMAPAAPMASATPRAQGGDMEEIRALAARLAELNRGSFLPTITEKEAYERNAPERRRVAAALAEAQRRYRSR